MKAGTLPAPTPRAGLPHEYAARTIALSSGTFEFTVDPGQTGSGEVTVMNDGDEPLKALVYVADVEVDDTGEQTFVAPQREGVAMLTTPASWFRVYMPADSKALGNTPYIELDPGERIPIKFEFVPPKGTAPGDHNTVIFFEMFDLPDGSDGSAAMVAGRLGARVAVRVTGQVVEKMTMRPFVVPGFVIGGDVPFTFTVNNDGNLNKRVEVTASLLDRNEQVVTDAAVATDTAIFANSRRQFTGTLAAPGGRLGPHTVEVVAEYLQDGAQVPSQLVEERTVWLVPLWLVALVGFLVLYVTGYFVVRALGRRRARRAARLAPETIRPDEAEEIPERAVDRGPRSERHAASAHHRASRRAREQEVDERRRRREERAAHTGTWDRETDRTTPET